MNYPYVCTRIRARKSMLFDSESYRRFIEIKTLKEFLEALAKTRYGKILKEAKPLLGDLDLLHHATVFFMGKEYMEIYRMLDQELQEKLYPIFAKADMHNIIATVRAKRTDLSKKELEFALIPAPTAKPELMLTLYELDLGGIILSLSNFPLMKGVKPGMELEEIEDIIFYNWLREMSQINVSVLKPYVSFLVSVYSALGVLRMKLAGRGEESISGLIVDRKWKVMAEADLESVIMEIQSTFGVTEEKYVDIETELEGLLIKKGIRLMRLNPISAAPIAGYLAAVEAETRNLRLIGYGINAGVPKQEIWRELVYESSGGH